MNITIDASCLILNPYSGLSNMAMNLIRYLAKLDKNNSYTIFINYFNKKYHSIIKYKGINIFTLKVPRRLIKFIWNHTNLPADLYLPKTDIFHSLHRLVPPTRKIKTIFNIHDCRFIAHPELYSKKEIDFYKKQIEISLKHSNLIITISNFMKNEIQKYLGIDESKIIVIYNGFDYKNISSLKGSSLPEHYRNKIPNKYILFLGPLEKRKNLYRLLLAYKKVIQKNSFFPDLVIAGISKNDFYKYLEYSNIDLSTIENKINIIGYTNRRNILLLISNAKALCYPSIYEGFGYPPLEAMACGVPVLTSNISSIPEIVGNAALMVNPLSIDEIYNGLEQIIYDENLSKKLVENGYNQIKKFPWEESASKYIKAYYSLFSN